MRLAVEQLSTLRASDIAKLQEPIDVVHGDKVIAQIYPAREGRRRSPPIEAPDPARIEAIRRAAERLNSMPRIELTDEQRRDIEAVVGPLDLD